MRNPTLYQTRFAPQARLVVVQFLCKCSGGLTNSCAGGTVSEQSRFHGARPAVRARNTYHMIVRDRGWKSEKVTFETLEEAMLWLFSSLWSGDQ